MKKKLLFYAFSAFVLLFTLVAWQFAKVELAELQNPSAADYEKRQVQR